jgi:methionyl aminopeptidase
MTISNESELTRLEEIGRIVANTLKAMGAAIEPGITTGELDRIGRGILEAAGARSGPSYAIIFPVRPASASMRKSPTASLASVASWRETS